MMCLFSLMSVASFSQQIFPTSNDNDPGAPIELNEVTIMDHRQFRNDTDRYNYNQMKYYVKTILPYLNQAVTLFGEIEQTTASMNKRDRRKYIRSREQEIKSKFQEPLSNLNITQGRYLVKLIHRQLSFNCYDIVRDLKNPITAAYYQSWARLNGINLNEDYDPHKEADLERIMKSLGY